MIDIKDIMVGNFVKGPCEHIEVYKIYACGIGNDCGDYYHNNEIEPIPITEEILEKIGFKEDTAIVKFYRYWDKDYKYKLDVDEGYTNSGKKWSVHIDNGDCATIGSGEFTYIHELQNLVRINCKADLPITKEMLYGLGDGA